MRMLDVNILLYASFDAYPQHKVARCWLDRALNDERVPLGIPWETLTAFVRIASNPRVFQPALSVDVAWRQVQIWLSSPSVWIPAPTEFHRQNLERLLMLPDMNCKLVADAHLAAIALEHGLTLVSADSDFKRFPNLQSENPLEKAR